MGVNNQNKPLEKLNYYELHNVSVFIDYENIYKALLPKHTNLLRLGFFEKLRAWCKGRGQRITKIVAYCNYDNKDLYESHHQTKLQEYGIETVHTSNRGKNYADMQITIDVINLMYLNPNIDEFIIISNDKDMSPLLNTIKANKRKVVLITADDNYDNLLNYIPDEIYKLDTILLEYPEEKIGIKDVEDAIYKGINKFINDNIEKASITHSYNHIELRFSIEKNASYHRIMQYEIANIYAGFIEKGDIILYKYDKNGRQFDGIASIDTKNELIKKGYINTENIVTKFDTINLVNDIYEAYIKKLKEEV